MNKYVIDLHKFSRKLRDALTSKKLVDKNGNPDPIKLHNILYPNDMIPESDIEKFGRSYFTEKTRKERNWINGANYPKTMNDILLLCNTLECDLDYFFTDMPCKTHDIQFIHQYTGLSENAINYLHDKSRTKRYINILNIFLDYGNFDNALFHIDRYMENVYLYQGLTKIRQERKEKTISECIQKDGDLISYNYPYNDALDKKIKDTEGKIDIEEFKIDQYFKFIIQKIKSISKEKAPSTN